MEKIDLKSVDGNIGGVMDNIYLSQGKYFEFSIFNTNKIFLDIIKSPDAGNIEVYVDDVLKKTVQLTDTNYNRTIVEIIPYLNDGNHKIKIKCIDGNTKIYNIFHIDYELNKKYYPQIIRFSDNFSANETKDIFELNAGEGKIVQLTFEVISNSQTNWKNTKLKIYLNGNNDNPILKLSPADIVKRLGYTNYNRDGLNVSTYYYSNNRKSKSSIILNMDFINGFKISATAGNGATTIRCYALYEIKYL